MRKKAVQQGRSERRGESYSVPYVEPLSDARTPLAVFFRILLESFAIEFGFSGKPCHKLLDGKMGMTGRFLLRAFTISPVDTLPHGQ